MAESFFRLSERDQSDLLEIGAQNGRPAHLREKDVWVVWSLAVLFDAPVGAALTFKGGTSLSKAYGVIDRFSEDVDLTYDIRKIVGDLIHGGAPLPQTRSQAKRWADAVRERLPVWLEESVLPVFDLAIQHDGVRVTAELGGPERDKILLHYAPTRRGTGYVAPTVQLEFGARATGEPNELRPVTCDLAALFGDVTFPSATPTVMRVERTFWEKATACHVYCAQHKLRGERFSRHWYDLAALRATEHFTHAMSARGVAEDVATHKTHFFSEKDARGDVIDYHGAVGGALRLVPEGQAYDALVADYARMTEDGILIGTPVPFARVVEACREIEREANKPPTQAIAR